jgi:hypothetical protein
MSTPISRVAALAVLLASCSAEPSEKGDPRIVADVAEQVAVAADSDALILCTSAREDGFARNCTVERSYDASGQMLTIRAPDGGFRRLREDRDGGWQAADGAERVAVRLVAEGLVEIAIGDMRYRLAERP